MSLINDVLRDLDARRRPTPQRATIAEGLTAASAGRRRWLSPALFAGALVVLGLGAWLGQSWAPASAPGAWAPAATPTPPAAVAAAPPLSPPIPSARVEAEPPPSSPAARTETIVAPEPPTVPVARTEQQSRVAPRERQTGVARGERQSAVARAEALHDEALRVAERYPAAARDLLLEALELAPRHRASREALATLLAREGQPSAALVVLATGRRHDPTHIGYLEVEARVRAAHGEVDAAIELLEDAVARRRDAGLLGLLAALERGRGRADRAAAHYRAALRLAPERAAYWLGLAIAEESLGNGQAALAAYRRALHAGLAPASQSWARERARALGG